MLHCEAWRLRCRRTARRSVRGLRALISPSRTRSSAMRRPCSTPRAPTALQPQASPHRLWHPPRASRRHLDPATERLVVRRSQQLYWHPCTAYGSEGAMGSVHYNVGDVVCLKSGGVNMVVGEVNGSFATCQWHDAHGKYNTAIFRVQTLTPGDLSKNLDNYRDEGMDSPSL